MSLYTKILAAVAAVGFGILHVVGGTILQQAPGRPTIEQTMPAQHGD